MPANDPAHRYMAAAVASNTRWAHEPDRTAATSPGRAAFMRRFEDDVDPERKLSSADRARRADSARRAYFMRLAIKSADSRRRAKNARANAAILDQAADDADEALGDAGDAA